MNSQTDSLDKSLQDISEELFNVMNFLLPKPQNGEARVIEAMRYSVLSKGKRLRPFLVVCSSDLFGVSRKSSLIAAAAIEFVHTYSLVHDDLPSMDDDSVRRGQPSCHVMYDEATAILAGDGLLTYAFQVLSDDRVHADAKVRCELISSLAAASGCHGMVGGQMMDIITEGSDATVDEVIRLQRLKTGELFAIACEAGAILGKAPIRQRSALRNYAHNLGLAFQITDDLMDAKGITREDGKAKDRTEKPRPTLVSLMGEERAFDQARILSEQAKTHLDSFGARAALMCELADFVISRKN